MVVFAKDLQRFHEEIIGKSVAHAKEVKPTVVVSSKLRKGILRLRLLMRRRIRCLMLLWLVIVV